MIQIKSEEQLVELAARSIWLLSNLRAFTKDMEYNRSIKMLYKDLDVETFELRIDQFLYQIGAVDFKSLKELIRALKIKHNDQWTSEKKIQPNDKGEGGEGNCDLE